MFRILFIFFSLLYAITVYSDTCDKLANNFNARLALKEGREAPELSLNKLRFSRHTGERPNKTALIFGGGSFGTAIASVLSHNFDTVLVKVRKLEDYHMLMEGLHKKLVKEGNGEALEINVVPVLTWEEVDQHAVLAPIELMVYGLPTSTMKTYPIENKSVFEKFLKQGVPLVSLSKGIDIETKLLPDDLLARAFPEYTDQLYYLSGPSFARELLEGRATSVSIAGNSKKGLGKVIDMFDTEFVRINPEADVKGLLLGGALKNPLAVASGMLSKLAPGDIDLHARLIAIGINELKKFYRAYHANPATIENLSGLGDIIATTMSPNSRNFDYGKTLIEEARKGIDGKKPHQITVKGGVVEGYKTAKSSYILLDELGIKSEYVKTIYQILYEGRKPEDLLTFIRNYPSPLGSSAADKNAKSLARKLRKVMAYGAGIVDSLNVDRLNTQALLTNYVLKEMNDVGSAKFSDVAIFRGTNGIVGYIKAGLDPSSPFMQAGKIVGSGSGQFSTAAKKEISEMKQLADTLGVKAPIINAIYDIAINGKSPNSLERVVLDLAAAQ